VVFSKYHKPTEHSTLSAAELAYINQEFQKSLVHPPRGQVVWHPQTWAYAIPKFLTDPILVVLSLLAAELLQR